MGRTRTVGYGAGHVRGYVYGYVHVFYMFYRFTWLNIDLLHRLRRLYTVIDTVIHRYCRY